MRDSSDQPVAAVPYVLGNGESVSRFIYSGRNMRMTDSRPKPAAFNPSPYNELSTVHSSGLNDNAIWNIGRQTLGASQGRTAIHARADVPVQSLSDVRLRALRDDKTFQRHTSVVDWPLRSDPNETKALWKEICLRLSEDPRIALLIPPGPISRV